MKKSFKQNAIDSFDVIEIDVSGLSPTLTIDDVFYLQDLKQRKLYLKEEVSDTSIAMIVRHILQYNRDDIGINTCERKPILLYVSSCGGSVDAGFELIDVILQSRTPVYTINLGYCYSMGLLIALAGQKRFASQNAKYLLHDGSEIIFNSSSKVRDQMEFHKIQDSRIKQYILSRSKLTSEEYDKNQRLEWFMFADQGKEKGFVDFIIGEDADVDEIV